MRNIILHSHIFKNAGTTFDYVLQKNFKNGFIDHREDEDIIQGKAQYLNTYLSNNMHVQAFSSHSVHFHPEDTQELKFHQIYFVRHPIERVMSVYNFEKKQGSTVSLGGKMANTLNFNDYVKWRMQEEIPATIRNIHTIFLSGMGPATHDIDRMFEAAKQYVDGSALIGVVDRFDDSMKVFKKELSQDFSTIDLTYQKKNVTDKSSTSLEVKIERVLSLLSKNVEKILMEKNQYDLELYNLVNANLTNKLIHV